MSEIAIIGGGASGMLCAAAIKLNNPKIKVTVFERLPKVLKKLSVTGNGKCNITNLNCSAADYFEASDFVTPSIEEYTPQSNIEFFKDIGLFCVCGQEGRVYPSSYSAYSVVTILSNQAVSLGVKVLTDVFVDEIDIKNHKYILNGKYAFDSVVIACGGKAAPKFGTDGSSYKLLKSLGHKIANPVPALVSLNAENFPHSLKGIRSVCSASLLIDGEKLYCETGEVQFTEYGLSGIPIMQMSRLVSKAESENIKIKLDCLPEFSEKDICNLLGSLKGEFSAEDAVNGILHRQLGNYIMSVCEVKKDMLFNRLTDRKIAQLACLIKNLEVKIISSRGFEFAQVTSGGAELSEFNKNTMESKRHKGLYAIGEALNVDGPCGGYNLQWAWSSARTAAKAIAKEF